MPQYSPGAPGYFPGYFPEREQPMDDTITLKVSKQGLDVIANALGQRPYMEVAQLLQEIGQQVQAQRPPPAAPPAANDAAGAAP